MKRERVPPCKSSIKGLLYWTQLLRATWILQGYKEPA